MRILILLFISSACFGQFVRDTDSAYVMWGDKYLVGTQGIIPNPPDPPDPPDPIIPGNFEGIVLFDIDFSEVGTAPFVNTTETARAFFPGIAADKFTRGGTAYIGHPEVDSIVLLDGDPCWRITILDDYVGHGTTRYGIEWQVNMAGSSFNNIQVDFDLYLGADWDMLDYSTGGKLLGFGAAHQNGDAPPTGGDFDDDDDEGMSNRVLFGNGYEIGTYNYIHQYRPSTAAQVWFPNNYNEIAPYVFETETWYHITMRGRQNTIGLYDGIVEFFVNGVSRMYSFHGHKFRTLAATSYDWLMLEIFAGGAVEPGFAGMSCWIDNVVYSVPDYNGSIGVGNTIGDENIPYTYTRVE